MGKTLEGQNKKDAVAKKMGRPTLKSPELVIEIIKRVISGQNIVQLCKASDMPSRDTVHTWLATDEDFSDKYVRACKLRRELKFYALEEIVDGTEDVNRARLKVDVIKWQLSKEDPKKYGEKLDHTTDGKELPAPILNIIGTNTTKHDIKREYIEPEVSEIAGEIQTTPIMDDINDNV
jgi:hypothetical protein